MYYYNNFILINDWQFNTLIRGIRWVFSAKKPAFVCRNWGIVQWVVISRIWCWCFRPKLKGRIKKLKEKLRKPPWRRKLDNYRERRKRRWKTRLNFRPKFCTFRSKNHRFGWRYNVQQGYRKHIKSHPTQLWTDKSELFQLFAHKINCLRSPS